MTTIVSLRSGHDGPVPHQPRRGRRLRRRDGVSHEGGRAAGQRHGKGAAKLGPTGEVDPQVIDRLSMDDIGPNGQDEDEIDRMVAKRIQRQQVLYQPAKRVQVVMLEGALTYARVVTVPTLAGQLDRLHFVIGLPTLELGIIPFEAAAPVFSLSGFRLYDDLVIAESIVREQRLAEADDVAPYEKYLELLRDAASTAPGHSAAIRRSLESLR